MRIINKENMKILLTLIILFSFQLTAQHKLSVGDTLNSYLENYPIEKTIDIGTQGSLPESKDMKFGVTFGDNKKSEFPKMVIAKNKYLIGIWQKINSSEAEYIYDYDGDGVLDFSEQKLIIPAWVLANEEEIDTTKDNVAEILDNYQNSFQSDVGLANPLFGKAILKVATEVYDTTKSNRFLTYLIKLYSDFTSSNPKIAIMTMQSLEANYVGFFHREHPVIYLFILESAINDGNKELAKSYLERLYKLSPDFIPCLVYQYRLEEDSVKKEKFKNDLILKYKNHWMVKSELHL